MKNNAMIYRGRLYAGLLRFTHTGVLCILMLLVGAVGQVNAGPFDGTVWGVLTKQDQDKILQTLANELEGVRAGRAAQGKADEQAAKTLSQLLDEVYKPNTETAWRKYSSEYATMAATALAADSAKFAQMAGAASVGDYAALHSELPRIGADVFASLVGDVLKAKGMVNSQLIWKELVARSNNLGLIATAYMRGDVDGALALAKSQILAEVKTASESAAVGAINWIFSDMGISPGAGYIQMITYEKEFIEWSQKTLSNYFIKDCFDLYVETYGDSHGDTDFALKRFNGCATLAGKAYAIREFEDVLQQSELDPQKVLIPMLEAYREYGQQPHSWITALHAEKVAQKNTKLATELALAHEELRASGDTFSAALGQRMLALMQAAISEDDMDALLAAARKALADSKADADAAINASAGAFAACTEFNDAMSRAAGLRAEMQRLDQAASHIRTLVKMEFDCSKADEAFANNLAEAHRLKGVVDGAVADADAAMDAACTANYQLKTAVDQPEALQFAQAARDAAAQGGAAVKIGMQAFQDFTPVLQGEAGNVGTEITYMNMAAVGRRFAELDGILEEIREANSAQIVSDFATAKAVMLRARVRAKNLTIHAEERAELVSGVLEPHRSGILSADVRAVLTTIDTELDSAQYCTRQVNKNWGTDSSRISWSRRSLVDSPDIAALEELISQVKKQCPRALDGGAAEAAAEQEIIEIYFDVKSAIVDLGIAKRGYELCMAAAFVDYSKLWGASSQPTPPPAETVEMPEVIGLDGEKAAGLVRAAGLGVNVVVQGLADKFDMNPGYVYEATASNGDMLPKGTTVTLTTYDNRPKIEVPAVANMTTQEATDVIEAAGFVVIDIDEGKPAPTAQETGMVYSSSPAHPAMHSKFAPVIPLIYGPPVVILLEVPSLKDITPQKAGDVLATYGDHFVLGPLALSPDRPAGSKLGEVHFSSPAAGEPVPQGTVVTLFVYAPLAEEIGNLRLIPSEITGMSADQAAGLLRGADDFFTVPAPRDGDVAQNGQTPGTVQYATPAAGTLALRGSSVQLFVYKEEKRQVSVQQCPDPNSDPSKYRHRYDTNNNPDDRTYIECLYFKDGNLQSQLPETNGEAHGVQLFYVSSEKCGKYLSSKYIVSHGEREKAWSYLCDRKTSSVYKSRVTIYSNGKKSSSTQWHSNGFVAAQSEYHANGKPKIIRQFNKKGEPTYCSLWDINGRLLSCDE